MSNPLPATTRVLEEGREQQWHLGAQVYVARRGREPVSIAFGERRPGELMTPDTLLAWRSAGKPLTSIAVAQLRDEGRLDFDDPVARHIPEFAAGGREAITIRHLLTHTSGLRTGDAVSPALPWDQVIQAVCHVALDPDATPGRTAAYQVQATWYLLAEIVRRIDGRAFAHAIRDRVLLPLGMSNSWIGMPHSEFESYGPRIGTTYVTFPPPPKPHPTLDSDSEVTQSNPGGGARGPAADLGRFYEALLDGGRGVLRPGTIAELTRPHRTGAFDQTFRAPVNMGLGFITSPEPPGADGVPYAYGPHASARAFGHSGAQSACAFADPEHGLAVAWVCNGLPGEPRHQRRQRAINAAIYEDVRAWG